MRVYLLAWSILLAPTAFAEAQDAVPDLRGTWTGTNKAIVLGTSEHHQHPERQSPEQARPRISEVTFTFVVEGQEGRHAWGTLSSPRMREKFVWTISHDNRTIIGSDRDGTFFNRLLEPNKLEICYTGTDHHGKTGTHLISVCHPFERKTP